MRPACRQAGAGEGQEKNMDLFFSAQDIQCITFGLVKDQTLFCEKTFDVPPENYLASLHTFLLEQSLSVSDIKRVFVVNGPGSFTASRVSVVIANTIAFTQQIGMVSIENPDRRPMRELMETVLQSKEQTFVVPAYDRPPNIT